MRTGAGSDSVLPFLAKSLKTRLQPQPRVEERGDEPET